MDMILVPEKQDQAVLSDCTTNETTITKCKLTNYYNHETVPSPYDYPTGCENQLPQHLVASFQIYFLKFHSCQSLPSLYL